MTDDSKVLVTYPDDTTRKTTIGELKALWTGNEPQTWIDNMIYELNTRRVANGKFGEYRLQ